MTKPTLEPVKTIGTNLSADAEVGTNQYGGKSTKLLARFDLLDAEALYSLAEQAALFYGHKTLLANVNAAIRSLKWATGHITLKPLNNLAYAQFAIHNAVALSMGDELPGTMERVGFCYDYTRLSAKALFCLAEVIGYGAARYTVNNWRAVPVEEHVNHALTHLVAFIGGDTQDDHLGHAFCRIHMALAVHYQGAPWIIGDDGVPRPQEAVAA